MSADIVISLSDSGPELVVSADVRQVPGGADIVVTIRSAAAEGAPLSPASRRRPFMGPATTVVERLGGKKALAAALGIPPSTIHSWMVKGVIPPKWYVPLITLGAKNGVVLMLADLAATPHPVT